MVLTKIKILNSIRKLYANSLGETLLLPFSKGSSPNGVIAKLTPSPSLYSVGSVRHVVREGLRLQLDISDTVDWYIYFSWRDDNWNTLFSLMHDGNVVLDIGTNIGYTLLRAAQKVGINGRAFGFEPVLYNFNRCIRNIALNQFKNASVEKVALGNLAGQQFITFPDIHNSGMNRLGLSNTQATGEQVDVIRLDDWVHQKSLTRIDVIKIDVEGFELNVLKGAESVIRQYQPKLFIEVNDSYLKHFGSSVAELFSWLDQEGYTLFDTKRNVINKDQQATIFHTDIVAVHQSKL